MLKTKKIYITMILATITFNSQATEKNYKASLGYDSVVEFIDKYSEKEKYSREEMIDFFARTNIKQSIIKDSKNQPEKKLTWNTYKKKVVTESKIKQGQLFVKENTDVLDAAEIEFGVPKEIIASIIGIESFYGKYKGDYNAIEAISTMAFEGGKRRQSFFQKELDSFFDNCYENGLNPLKQKSSWAGAFGYPQFIPSSIKAYGIDYDKDGVVDLNNSVVDAIGSVANYLKQSGWKEKNYVAEQVSYRGGDLSVEGLKLKYTVQDLKENGVLFKRNMRKDKPAKIFKLIGEKEDPIYYVGYKNFKAITMYNRSNLYAMAVFQLSNEIKGDEVL